MSAASLAPREAWATFPLFRVNDGVCECRDGAACTATGKHPAYAWGTLKAGEKVRGRDGCGYGIATGERSDVIVLDLDSDAAIDWAVNKGLPETYAVATGREGGGLHLYFRAPNFLVRNSSGKIAPGVDVRGEGGFVVAEGSPHRSGATYTGNRVDIIADAPAWLLEWPGLRAADKAPTIEASTRLHPSGADREQRMAYAAKWLENTAPCISGDGGQKQIWHVGCRLMQWEALSIEDATALFEPYNERCEPPWEAADIARTLARARDAATDGGVFDEDAFDGRGKWEAFCANLADLAGANDTAEPRSCSLLARLEERKEVLQTEPTAEFERGDHAELSAELIRCNGRPLVTTEGAIWEYETETGAWTSHRVEARLRNEILGFAGRLKKGGKKGPAQIRINHSDVEGIIKAVRARTFEEEFFAIGKAGIACINGLITLDGVVPHSPENRSRSAYPFTFDPAATAPMFQHFLESLFEGDADQAEKIEFLQDFFGGALFGMSAKYDKYLLAKGEGANGKSTLFELVSDLFPKHQVQAIPPEKWDHAFTVAELVGCLLNVVADIGAESLKDSPTLKKVVAGDKIQAERKHQPSFAFQPIAAHAFGANPDLETRDQTVGFWRRPIVIEFNRNFEKDPAKDPEIATKILAAERAGILAWLVCGAKRLDARKKYTTPASHARALEAWKMGSDNVRQFADEYVSPSASPDARENHAASRVYRTYKNWALDNGYKAASSKTFKARFERAPGVTPMARQASGYVYRFCLVPGRPLSMMLE
jgi:P4 family phage/plasmid primase-like protien